MEGWGTNVCVRLVHRLRRWPKPHTDIVRRERQHRPSTLHFVIIINVLASSFRFIWMHMLWVYTAIINTLFFQCGDRLKTSESEVGPRTERVDRRPLILFNDVELITQRKKYYWTIHWYVHEDHQQQHYSQLIYKVKATYEALTLSCKAKRQ